jgi:hypothetical protein
MVVFDDMEPREKLRIYDKGVDRPPVRILWRSLAVREGDIFIPRIPNVEPLAQVAAFRARGSGHRSAALGRGRSAGRTRL